MRQQENIKSYKCDGYVSCYDYAVYDIAFIFTYEEGAEENYEENGKEGYFYIDQVGIGGNQSP